MEIKEKLGTELSRYWSPADRKQVYFFFDNSTVVRSNS